MTIVTGVSYSVREINRQGRGMNFSPRKQQMKGTAEQTSAWVLCGECGHTSRVLSIMASRVLKERQHCPQCRSTAAPSLHHTAAGAHIHPAGAQLN